MLLPYYHYCHRGFRNSRLQGLFFFPYFLDRLKECSFLLLPRVCMNLFYVRRRSALVCGASRGLSLERPVGCIECASEPTDGDLGKTPDVVSAVQRLSAQLPSLPYYHTASSHLISPTLSSTFKTATGSSEKRPATTYCSALEDSSPPALSQTELTHLTTFNYHQR